MAKGWLQGSIDNGCLNTYIPIVARPLHIELKQNKPFDLLEEETHLLSLIHI